MLYIARCRRAGFTLIEIMIVIAIIAILAGIAIPNAMQARAESQLSACNQNLKTIAQAVEMYSVRHDIKRKPFGTAEPYGNWSGTCDFLVEAGFLDKVPECPFMPGHSRDEEGYYFAINDNVTAYTWTDCAGQLIPEYPSWRVFCSFDHIVGERILFAIYMDGSGIINIDYTE